MFCPRCGFEYTADGNFCVRCGTKRPTVEDEKETIEPEMIQEQLEPDVSGVESQSLDQDHSPVKETLGTEAHHSYAAKTEQKSANNSSFDTGKGFSETSSTVMPQSSKSMKYVVAVIAILVLIALAVIFVVTCLVQDSSEYNAYSDPEIIYRDAPNETYPAENPGNNVTSEATLDQINLDCISLYNTILREAFNGATLSNESIAFLSDNMNWFPYKDYPSHERGNYEESWDVIEGWADCEWRWSGQYSKDLYENVEAFYSHPLYIHGVVYPIQSVADKKTWTTTIDGREYVQTILYMNTMDDNVLYAFIYNGYEELFLESLLLGIDCIGVPIGRGEYIDENGFTVDCVLFAAAAIFG